MSSTADAHPLVIAVIDRAGHQRCKIFVAFLVSCLNTMKKKHTKKMIPKCLDIPSILSRNWTFRFHTSEGIPNSDSFVFDIVCGNPRHFADYYGSCARSNEIVFWRF